MEAEQPGLTIEQIVARRPSISGVHLAQWVVKNEVSVGRVIEKDGRYLLNRERWTPRQIAALRELSNAVR